MPGITAYGAYIPLHRLSRAEIARAWGGKTAPGERAVASYDEDSLTMAHSPDAAYGQREGQAGGTDDGMPTSGGESQDPGGEFVPRDQD